MQARGLDVMPTTISRFQNGGDQETATLLEKVVYPEEITHCAAGIKWFKYLCSRSGDPSRAINFSISQEAGSNEVDDDDDAKQENSKVIQKFHETVSTYFRGPLKPPFNEAARRAAGFGPEWYEPLSVKVYPTAENVLAI